MTRLSKAANLTSSRQHGMSRTLRGQLYSPPLLKIDSVYKLCPHCTDRRCNNAHRTRGSLLAQFSSLLPESRRQKPKGRHGLVTLPMMQCLYESSSEQYHKAYEDNCSWSSASPTQYRSVVLSGLQNAWVLTRFEL